jgi:hypothetical protein
VVLVLSGSQQGVVAAASEGPTRRCLYVLISPKRCSTRKISRLSERLAGRGTMRTCTEREGRCAATLRTDMAGVKWVKCTEREMLSCSKSPKWVTNLPKRSRCVSRGSGQLGHEETFMHVTDGSGVPNV